jgi:hypothetical protein
MEASGALWRAMRGLAPVTLGAVPVVRVLRNVRADLRIFNFPLD